MSTQSTKNETGMIYEIMPAIMAQVPTIAKDRKNAQQGYSFRGIDDVYNALNPILAKHGVFMRAEVKDVHREERPSKSGGIMAFVQVNVRYYFVAKDGSSVFTDALGEGMDSGDKATAKAMSVAQKYALFQALLIPTADSKDIENDNPEPAYVPPPAPEPLAQEQRAKLATLLSDMGEAGIDPAEKSDKILEHFKVGSIGDLTRTQADAVIKKWTAMLKAEAKK